MLTMSSTWNNSFTATMTSVPDFEATANTGYWFFGIQIRVDPYSLLKICLMCLREMGFVQPTVTIGVDMEVLHSWIQGTMQKNEQKLYS